MEQTHDSEGKITLVRVRRFRSRPLRTPDIVASCTQEILELRSTPVAEDTGRELFGSGTGQALAPVCHFPGQGRDCGDVRHVRIPEPGTADASGWVTEDIGSIQDYEASKPTNPITPDFYTQLSLDRP